ncbi:MAG: PfkB family carbohydrate kinase, partial [Woeseiaceae bacterium]
TSALAATDIDCHVTTLTGITPMQYIEIEPYGEKRFVRYEEGVLKDFEFNRQQRDIIAASALMVAPVYLQIVDLYNNLLSIETDGTVAIDFADFLHHPNFALLEKHIDTIDIGFFGLTNEDTVSIEHIASLAAKYDKLFIVTLGADGSCAFHGAKRFQCAAVPVEKVVDTTGAGDAFAAAFLSRYCYGAGIQASLQRGAELAASVITKLGSHSEQTL